MSEKKKQNLKYCKSSTKETGAISWDILLVDIIGPHKIIREGHCDPIILKPLTMIDLATIWFEIVQ